jgi:hypothetical protein
MKKNHFKLLIFLIICNFSFSQNKANFTLENFKIKLIESPVSSSYIDTYAEIKWDSNLVNKTTTLMKLYLEIVPIMDCWNNVEAKDLKTTIFVELKSKSAINIDNYMITHKDLFSKCFKWRVRFEGTQGNQFTSWDYHLFIK